MAVVDDWVKSWMVRVVDWKWSRRVSLTDALSLAYLAVVAVKSSACSVLVP